MRGFSACDFSSYTYNLPIVTDHYYWPGQIIHEIKKQLLVSRETIQATRYRPIH